MDSKNETDSIPDNSDKPSAPDVAPDQPVETPPEEAETQKVFEAAETSQPEDPAEPTEESNESDPADDTPAEAKDEDQEPAATDAADKPNRFKRLWGSYTSHKKWTIPATVLILLVLLAAIPFTRYALAGTVISENYQVAVLDSKTNMPVSKATVTMDGKTAETDNLGNVKMHVHVGNHTLDVSKKYYQSSSANVPVPFNSKGLSSVKLVATGRQVPITVTNKLSGKPVSNAVVAAAGTSVKTDILGKATIVLPTDKATQDATIKANGYNDSTANLEVTDQNVAANQLKITPAGKVYFLSDLSGKLDVVKVNLDGTDRKTVLAGTGNEDDNSTQLVASRDWKYLVLKAQRNSTGGDKLYLINTATDAFSTVDAGTTEYSPIGWLGDNFFYTTFNSGVSSWQPHRQSMKMFNASSAKLSTIDQTVGSGTSDYDYAYTSFDYQDIVGNQVVYTTDWSSSKALDTTQQASVATVSPSGNKTVLKSFQAPTGWPYMSVAINQHGPNSTYVQVPVADSKNVYYDYDGSNLQINGTITETIFYKTYPTYSLSADSTQTFWSEIRDGKNTLLVGDSNGQSPTQIAALSDYEAFGWFDQYLLVSKNNTELYVMSRDGKTVTKVADYHQPPNERDGYYGFNYGGR